MYVLTRDQMISGNVLFYQMGNISPLDYLPSLKSGRGRSTQGTLPEFFLVAKFLLPEFFLVAEFFLAATDARDFY